jgi:dipeptidyl aminopeptidase/acylaminoacyl peptidase
LLALSACTQGSAPTPFPTPQILTLISPSTPTAIVEIEPSPAPSPTEDPFSGLTIADLSTRSYGEGEIQFSTEQRVSTSFGRYFFDYPSDGLMVHGFLNLPRGDGPFPVVLVLHGYIDPEEYETLAYTTRYADALAAEGFTVLHPNYRNYPPSDSGPNDFRVGYAVDVLNLIALVREQAGQPGPLENADPDSIGLFGHSMGGGITLRVIASQAPVQAAVLYGSMNADEALNFEKIYEWSEGERGLEELNTPPQDLARISPVFYLDGVTAAVSIHHGEEDELVPPEWSEDLCRRFRALGKHVECFTYPNESHTFIGFGGIQLIDRTVEFYGEHLSSP